MLLEHGKLQRGHGVPGWTQVFDSNMLTYCTQRFVLYTFFLNITFQLTFEIFFVLKVPQGAEDVAVHGPVGHRDHEEPEGRHGSARVFC